MLYCHGCVARMPPEARCTALPLHRETGEPWSPKPPRFGFQPSILKSASSSSLLIAVQGIKLLLTCNLRLPSHGLARPQNTGRGSRHSFNFHNTTIPRFDPGSAALRARRRWAFAQRARAVPQGQTVTLSGIGHTWTRASTSARASAERRTGTLRSISVVYVFSSRTVAHGHAVLRV